MDGAAALEGLLRRDRAVVVAALVAVIVLSWVYLVLGAGMEMPVMQPMDGMAMGWSPSYFALMLLMWVIMMAAMMLPSAAPMILLYVTISRQRQEQGAPLPASAIFALGYVAIWSACALAATSLQWTLDEAALLSPGMALTNKVVASALLIAAGVYQWTPLKQACLRRCRSPLHFVLSYWREGPWGSFAMGMRHGAFCLGCCWMLMLLLFAGGVMNLLWISALAIFVLVEKTAPGGHWIGRVAGVVLAGSGAAQLAFVAWS